MAKDLFSQVAEKYQAYRPQYPPSLIRYVLAHASARENAWDAATGNGQAASLIAPHVARVYATDYSQRQISLAKPDPRITYSVCPAEHTDFPDHFFDLITVAQAYHWLDFDAFAREVRRIARVGALIAVWGYGLVESSDRRISDIIEKFYGVTLKGYWDPERRYVEDAYQSAPFPFEELPPARFRTAMNYASEGLIGLLKSWSAVQQFVRVNHFNPVDRIAPEIRRIWKPGDNPVFSFPLFLRLGRVVK
jgi:hypothetical protein